MLKKLFSISDMLWVVAQLVENGREFRHLPRPEQGQLGLQADLPFSVHFSVDFSDFATLKNKYFSLIQNDNAASVLLHYKDP